jgi:Bacterial Ig domain
MHRRKLNSMLLKSWLGCCVCLLLAVSAFSQAPIFNTVVFNCSSGFATSGSCGVQTSQGGSGPFAVVGTTNGSTPGVSGSQVNLINAGCTHCALTLMYQGAQVNVQQFQATYTFIPNGWNISFVVNNTNNQPLFNGDAFSAGAGCEGGFFQGFAASSPNAPNNLFALMLDQYGSETATYFGDFQYSNVQIYQGSYAENAPNPPGQSPCNPDLSNLNPPVPENFTYASVTKFSTSPVPLNSPATTINTTTGHTYSATITYDGNNVILTLYDVTAGGTCTPVTSGTCFTHTWSGVNIPSMVGNSNTAWVGLIGSTNGSVPNPLLVKTFTYYIPSAASPPPPPAPPPPSPAPAVAMSSPRSSETMTAPKSVSIAASATASSGIAAMTITADSRTLKTCVNTTACAATWPASEIKVGTHTITTTAIDKAGVKGSASAVITRIQNKSGGSNSN